MNKRLVISILTALMLVTLACGQLAEQANEQGNSAFAGQNYEAALSSYQQATSRAPNLAEPRYNLGNAHYSRGDFNEAIEQYQASLFNADDAQTQTSLFNLGNAYFQQRNFEAAIDSYKEVLRYDPNNEDARYNLELALRQLGGESSDADQEQQDTQQDPDQSLDDQEGQNSEEEIEDVVQEPEDQQSEEDEQGKDSEDDDRGQSDVPELTPEQAKQLLDSIGKSTESLRGHLHQVFVVSGDSPTNDW